MQACGHFGPALPSVTQARATRYGHDAMKPTALLRAQHAACSRPSSASTGGGRFAEWLEDFDVGSSGKSFKATHERADRGKMCMTLERPRDPSKEFWKGSGDISKAKVRALAIQRHAIMVQQEKALHERLKKDGLGITKTFEPPREVKWKGAHGENISLGMDRKVEAKEKAAAAIVASKMEVTEECL